MESAKVERRGFAVGLDDGLPNVAIAAKEIVLILEEAEKMGFRVYKRGGRKGKDDELLFLQKRVDPCHAWETRPLDGVPKNVNVMHGVCGEKV